MSPLNYSNVPAAKREVKKGFKFIHPTAEQYVNFKSTFPFEETDDQSTAINAVLSDMCQAKAMDRLVCGDVGFGKTEVAMRATFLAVDNSKQSGRFSTNHLTCSATL